MGTTNYTWNPLTDSVIEESDGSGNVLATYTNKPAAFGPLVSENRGGTTSYYHFDALGSTRLMTNSAQTVTDTSTFDAWGSTVAKTGTNPTPYRWCGKSGYQSDSTLGSAYVRARTYKPSIARWSSIDLMSFRRRFALRYAFLQYCYGINSPLRSTDSSGMDQPPQLIETAPTNPDWVFNGSLYVWRIDSLGTLRTGVFNPLTSPEEAFAAWERYMDEWLMQSSIRDVPDAEEPILPELDPGTLELPPAPELPDNPIILERPNANTTGIAGMLSIDAGTLVNPLTLNPVTIGGTPVRIGIGFVFSFQRDPNHQSFILDPHESWLFPYINFGAPPPRELEPAQ